MWMARSLRQFNTLSHTWHLYGFSPLWILLCTVRSLRLCLVNEYLSRKHFPHSLHLCLLLWIFVCFVKQSLVEKHFWHSVHEYTLSPPWLLPPSLKLRWFSNCSSHSVQSGDLGFLFCRCLLISTSDRIVLQLSPTHYSAQYSGYFTNVSFLFPTIWLNISLLTTIHKCITQKIRKTDQTNGYVTAIFYNNKNLPEIVGNKI